MRFFSNFLLLSIVSFIWIDEKTIPLVEKEKNLPRVALAIKCTAKQLFEWEKLISALPPSTRSNLTLFFTIYGDSDNFTTKTSLIKLLHNPSNLNPAVLAHLAPTATQSWTPGRNELLRFMYANEVERGERFTYWVTADGDTSHLDCSQCSQTRPPNYMSSACCWDILLGDTLNSDGLAFAIVGTMLGGEELPFFGNSREGIRGPFRQYLFRDCTDAQINAFHRDAVPVVHPFHEEFEHVSWWASQYLQFAYTSACLRGGIAVLEGNLHVWDNEHTFAYHPLPQYKEMHDFIERENPDLWGRVIFPNRQCHSPADIRNNYRDAVIYLASGEDEGETVSNIPVAPRVRWNETCAYAMCYASRHPLFLKTVGQGIPEAPRRKNMKAGWVWGWQGTPFEAIPSLPYWSDKTQLSGFSEDCSD